MSGKAVELNVAGQNCRVVTTANESELQLLATMVEEKLAGVVASGRPVTTQAMLLAAVALAAEVQEQRARADAIANKARTALTAMLHRVDAALENSEAAPSEDGRNRGKTSKRGSRTTKSKRDTTTTAQTRHHSDDE